MSFPSIPKVPDFLNPLHAFQTGLSAARTSLEYLSNWTSWETSKQTKQDALFKALVKSDDQNKTTLDPLDIYLKKIIRLTQGFGPNAEEKAAQLVNADLLYSKLGFKNAYALLVWCHASGRSLNSEEAIAETLFRQALDKLIFKHFKDFEALPNSFKQHPFIDKAQVNPTFMAHLNSLAAYEKRLQKAALFCLKGLALTVGGTLLGEYFFSTFPKLPLANDLVLEIDPSKVSFLNTSSIYNPNLMLVEVEPGGFCAALDLPFQKPSDAPQPKTRTPEPAGVLKKRDRYGDPATHPSHVEKGTGLQAEIDENNREVTNPNEASETGPATVEPGITPVTTPIASREEFDAKTDPGPRIVAEEEGQNTDSATPPSRDLKLDGDSISLTANIDSPSLNKPDWILNALKLIGAVFTVFIVYKAGKPAWSGVPIKTLPSNAKDTAAKLESTTSEPVPVLLTEADADDQMRMREIIGSLSSNTLDFEDLFQALSVAFGDIRDENNLSGVVDTSTALSPTKVTPLRPTSDLKSPGTPFTKIKARLDSNPSDTTKIKHNKALFGEVSRILQTIDHPLAAKFEAARLEIVSINDKLTDSINEANKLVRKYEDKETGISERTVYKAFESILRKIKRRNKLHEAIANFFVALVKRIQASGTETGSPQKSPPPKSPIPLSTALAEFTAAHSFATPALLRTSSDGMYLGTSPTASAALMLSPIPHSKLVSAGSPPASVSAAQIDPTLSDDPTGASMPQDALIPVPPADGFRGPESPRPTKGVTVPSAPPPPLMPSGGFASPMSSRSTVPNAPTPPGMLPSGFASPIASGLTAQKAQTPPREPLLVAPVPPSPPGAHAATLVLATKDTPTALGEAKANALALVDPTAEAHKGVFTLDRWISGLTKPEDLFDPSVKERTQALIARANRRWVTTLTEFFLGMQERSSPEYFLIPLLVMPESEKAKAQVRALDASIGNFHRLIETKRMDKGLAEKMIKNFEAEKRKLTLSTETTMRVDVKRARGEKTPEEIKRLLAKKYTTDELWLLIDIAAQGTMTLANEALKAQARTEVLEFPKSEEDAQTKMVGVSDYKEKNKIFRRPFLNYLYGIHSREMLAFLSGARNRITFVEKALTNRIEAKGAFDDADASREPDMYPPLFNPATCKPDVVVVSKGTASDFDISHVLGGRSRLRPTDHRTPKPPSTPVAVDPIARITERRKVIRSPGEEDDEESQVIRSPAGFRERRVEKHHYEVNLSKMFDYLLMKLRRQTTPVVDDVKRPVSDESGDLQSQLRALTADQKTFSDNSTSPTIFTKYLPFRDCFVSYLSGVVNLPKAKNELESYLAATGGEIFAFFTCLPSFLERAEKTVDSTALTPASLGDEKKSRAPNPPGASIVVGGPVASKRFVLPGSKKALMPALTPLGAVPAKKPPAEQLRADRTVIEKWLSMDFTGFVQDFGKLDSIQLEQELEKNQDFLRMRNCTCIYESVLKTYLEASGQKANTKLTTAALMEQIHIVELLQENARARAGG